MEISDKDTRLDFLREFNARLDLSNLASRNFGGHVNPANSVELEKWLRLPSRARRFNQIE